MTSQDIPPGVHEVAITGSDLGADGAGLVLRWRRNGDVLEGLVSYELDGEITSEWLPALSLTPTGRPVAAENVQAAEIQAAGA